MTDETEFMEIVDCDNDADVACKCGSTLDLIFEDDGGVICEDCFFNRGCDED